MADQFRIRIETSYAANYTESNLVMGKAELARWLRAKARQLEKEGIPVWESLGITIHSPE